MASFLNFLGGARPKVRTPAIDGVGDESPASRTPRLDNLEISVKGLVKLAGLHEQVHQRFASAIDEMEKRQANALHVVNAAFVGLQRTVQQTHGDTVAMAKAVQAALDEVTKLLGPPAVATPAPGLAAALEPPAVSPQPGAGAPSNISAISRFAERPRVNVRFDSADADESWADAKERAETEAGV